MRFNCTTQFKIDFFYDRLLFVEKCLEKCLTWYEFEAPNLILNFCVHLMKKIGQ